MTQQPPDSADLFQDAEYCGELSPASAALLTGLSARINKTMAALPVKPLVTDQTLLCMLLDNSPSMENQRNHVAAVEGHNAVVNALQQARALNSVESLSMLLNPNPRYIRNITGDTDDFRWGAIRTAPRLDHKRFIHGGSTPLYDRSLETLGSVLARTKWWEDTYGVQARSITLLMTDGGDNDSKSTADDVARVVADMLTMEKHQIFFMGLQCPGTDFKKIGASMGIPDGCIGVVERDAKAIRDKFQLFSQSAVALAVNPNAVSGSAFGY
jgi:hypothetical protein